MQHHEDVLGRGYPNRLMRDQIHPIARLVAVADVFCDYAIQGPDGPGRSAWGTVRQILRFKKEALDVTYLSALLRALDKESIQKPK